MSKIKELIQVSPEEIKKVRDAYGKTEESIQEDLTILKEWMKKQPHLPQMNDDARLERLLVRNKFRIEQTKRKIDNYFTLRGIHPELLQRYVDHNDMFANFTKGNLFLPMPQMTDKQERVIIYRVLDSNPDYFTCLDLSSYIIMISDINLSHDYCIGQRIINDWGGFTMGHLKKLDPSIMVKLLKLHQEAFSDRIISFDYVNCPPFMDILLQILKPIFKDKIYGRIAIHKDMESLYKSIPKRYLPEEYGGEKGPLNGLHEEWKLEVRRQKKFLEDNAKLISNEKLRVGEVLFESELYGTEGTFKKLNLD